MQPRVITCVPEASWPSVRGAVQPYAACARVDTPEALPARVVASGPVAAVVEVLPGDVSATCRALAATRAISPLLPVLALVRAPDAACLRGLASADVELAPVGLPPVLHRFVQRALVFGQLPDPAVARWVSHLASAHGLTPREVAIVGMALGHVVRPRMRDVFGVEENTLKAQIRSLLRKVGEPTLDTLAKNVLRTALLEARPGSRGLYRGPWWRGDRPPRACQALSTPPSPGGSSCPTVRASGS